uniref:Ig-like domain-containing protein n=1 Tax=Amphimedon queenslandica TaxID=400682 RepID=A0A1X7SEW6_AMPQE
MFNVTLVPINSTSLVLKPTKPYYEVGSDVTLSCKVTEPNSPLVDINTTANIKWNSNKNIYQQYSFHRYNSYFNHTLTNIKLSDAGEYNCTYYLTGTTDNPYIIPSDVRTGVTNVTIEIPNGNNPSITQLNSYYNVGDSISFICSVTYPHSPLIDIATNVNIQWLDSSNHTLHSYTGINNNTEHTISYTIDGNNTVISNTAYLCIKVPVMDSTLDANLRLGDIREYDCTLGYRYSGVTVQWLEYGSNKVLNNPLILTMNQSVNNAYYMCLVTVDKNPKNCPS